MLNRKNVCSTPIYISTTLYYCFQKKKNLPWEGVFLLVVVHLYSTSMAIVVNSKIQWRKMLAGCFSIQRIEMKLEIQLNHFFCRKRPSYLNICLSKKLKKNEVRDGGGSRSNFIWICAKGLKVLCVYYVYGMLLDVMVPALSWGNNNKRSSENLYHIILYIYYDIRKL